MREYAPCLEAHRPTGLDHCCRGQGDKPRLGFVYQRGEGTWSHNCGCVRRRIETEGYSATAPTGAPASSRTVGCHPGAIVTATALRDEECDWSGLSAGDRFDSRCTESGDVIAPSSAQWEAHGRYAQRIPALRACREESTEGSRDSPSCQKDGRTLAQAIRASRDAVPTCCEQMSISSELLVSDGSAERWSDRASGESDKLEDDGWVACCGMYASPVPQVITVYITRGAACGGIEARRALTTESWGNMRMADDAGPHAGGVRLWAADDLAFSIDGVDTSYAAGGHLFNVEGGRAHLEVDGGSRPIRVTSDLLFNPWFAGQHRNPLRRAAEGRGVIFDFLNALGNGQLSVTRKLGEPGSVFLDCALPYHPGYYVPAEYVIRGACQRDWWTGSVSLTNQGEGPGALCSHILVPVDWAESIFLPSRREPSSIRSAKGMTRYVDGVDTCSLTEVQGGLGGPGKPVYVCKGDLIYSPNPTLVVDKELVGAMEERGVEYHIAGCTPGVTFIDSVVIDYISECWLKIVCDVDPKQEVFHPGYQAIDDVARYVRG